MNQKEAINLMVLKYIDAFIDLNNEINTNDITNVFPIHRTKVSILFQTYITDNPSNMRYNPSRKKYIKGYLFERGYLKTNSFSFLNAIELVYSKEVK